MDRALEHDPGGAAGDARRLDHADRDARHLPRHPPRSARPRQQLLPAVDDPRLPGRLQRADRQPRPARRHVRTRPHLQPRLRHLHRRLAAADDRLDDRAGGRHLPDRLPHRPGGRRRLPAGQRGGDHHRRLPGQPARHGARDQQHRRRQRHVRRPRAGRAAGADRLAPRLPDLGPGRALRHRLGLPQAGGAQQAAPRLDRLVGQRDLRPRPDPGDGRGHLRHPPLRRLADRLGQPAGARPARRFGALAGGLRGDRAAGRRADVPAGAVPHPRLHLRHPLDLPRGGRPRRPAVHADHLAAGHLAAPARLRLHRNAALGGYLHAAADRRDPDRRADLRATSPTASAPARSPPAG